MTQLLKNFVHFFVLPCKEATFLIEKKLHGRLSFREKIQLKAHLAICKLCAAYNQKAILLHKTLQKYFIQKKTEIDTNSAESDFKNRIKERLKCETNS
ncbi:MAG: hypothetical protein Q4C98_01575 [Capnocytophaga sp.]|nr:hypothetical protein [Capnocytophaga sp.]